MNIQEKIKRLQQLNIRLLAKVEENKRIIETMQELEKKQQQSKGKN